MWAGEDQQASERGEPWRKPGKEDRILTGTVKGQEGIYMVTAGAVVIIMHERTGDVNIIKTGEIENWNPAEMTVIRAGVEEEEEGGLRTGGPGRRHQEAGDLQADQQEGGAPGQGLEGPGGQVQAEEGQARAEGEDRGGHQGGGRLRGREVRGGPGQGQHRPVP